LKKFQGVARVNRSEMAGHEAIVSGEPSFHATVAQCPKTRCTIEVSLQSVRSFLRVWLWFSCAISSSLALVVKGNCTVLAKLQVLYLGDVARTKQSINANAALETQRFFGTSDKLNEA
jgi:hypothetical protein